LGQVRVARLLAQMRPNRVNSNSEGRYLDIVGGEDILSARGHPEGNPPVAPREMSVL
jgi:hypothetical protein